VRWNGFAARLRPSARSSRIVTPHGYGSWRIAAQPIEVHLNGTFTRPEPNVMEHIEPAILTQPAAVKQLLGNERALVPDREAVLCADSFANQRLPHVLREFRQLLITALSAFLDALRP
jgi:hypothetical protein